MCRRDPTDLVMLRWPPGWYLQFVDNSPEARMRAAAAKATRGFVSGQICLTWTLASLGIAASSFTRTHAASGERGR